MPCCSPPLCRHARTPPRHPATHAAAPSDPRTGWRRQARARWAARAARPSARRHEGWRHAPTRASPPQVTQSAPNPRFGSGPARCAAPRFQRRPDEVAVAGAPSATRPHAGPSRPRSTASSERPAGSRRARLPSPASASGGPACRCSVFRLASVWSSRPPNAPVPRARPPPELGIQP